jgi:hypothetical protein
MGDVLLDTMDASVPPLHVRLIPAYVKRALALFPIATYERDVQVVLGVLVEMLEQGQERLAMAVLVLVLESIATRLAGLLWADDGEGFAAEYRRMEEAVEAAKEAEENGEDPVDTGSALDDGHAAVEVKLCKSMILLLCKPLKVVSLALLPLICGLIGRFIGAGDGGGGNGGGGNGGGGNGGGGNEGVGNGGGDGSIVVDAAGTATSTTSRFPPASRPLVLALLFESVNAHPDMVRKNQLAGWYLGLADTVDAAARDANMRL